MAEWEEEEGEEGEQGPSDLQISALVDYEHNKQTQCTCMQRQDRGGKDQKLPMMEKEGSVHFLPFD